MKIEIRNTCSYSKINKKYLPLIKDIMKLYKKIAKDEIIDVRLMGSVVRGESLGKNSDIDFVAITRNIIPKDIKKKRDKYSKNLLKKHPLAIKIDMFFLPKSKIDEYKRFVLTTDSISLWGKDYFSKKEFRIDSKKLVNLVVPDIRKLLFEYKERLKSLKEEEDVRIISRLTGKNIFHYFKKDLILKKGIYAKSMKEIYKDLIKYFPENKNLYDKVFKIYKHPTKNKKKIIEIIEELDK